MRKIRGKSTHCPSLFPNVLTCSAIWAHDGGALPLQNHLTKRRHSVSCTLHRITSQGAGCRNAISEDVLLNRDTRTCFVSEDARAFNSSTCGNTVSYNTL